MTSREHFKAHLKEMEKMVQHFICFLFFEYPYSFNPLTRIGRYDWLKA